LQERVIERLGGRAEIPVDVRIVAATHQDMRSLVQDGRFRLDLYYRLNVIPIRLPSLRERTGDIKLLVRHLLSQLNQRHQRNLLILPTALSSLVSYPWPGNIRQLYNVLERLVLLSQSDAIDEAAVDYVLVTEAQGQIAESIPLAKAAPEPAVPTSTAMPTAPATQVRSYQPVAGNEREHIHAALHAHAGNKSQTAKTLNLTLRQLNYRIRVLGIATPDRSAYKR
jgi:Nif-specific regulatory protein